MPENEYEVVYQVKFKVKVKVEPGQDLDDAIADINPPEDGVSEYQVNSFSIVSVKNHQGKDLME